MERDQAAKLLNDLLILLVSRNGSDLFITCDFPTQTHCDYTPEWISAITAFAKNGSRVTSIHYDQLHRVDGPLLTAKDQNCLLPAKDCF